jgi:catechol 2,3-dioxygenase-like lactoylglutathione lyase family enzyme
MLGSSSPVAFLTTTDAPRARAFFQDTLGLTFVADDAFALVFDLVGTPLRVVRVDEFQPQPFTVLGWSVPDIEATVRALAVRGVSFRRYPELEQDALGIWTSPSGSRIAWFTDPDGNLLSIGEPPRR